MRVCKRRSLEKIARLLSVRRSHKADTTPSAGARLRTSSRGARRAGTGIGRGDRGRTGTGSWSGVREQDPAGARTFGGIQRRLDTITCDGNYYGLIAFHNTVKGVMYGESGFV